MSTDKPTPCLYDSDQREAVEAHIACFFGDADSVFHEVYSPDIQVEVAIVEPTDEASWVTLVTTGAGARPMAIPPELVDEVPDRAEYLICLPPDWHFNQDEATGEVPEAQYWPIRLLKDLARLPLESGGWLAAGHTVDWGAAFSSETALSGVLLLGPYQFEEGAEAAELPDGELVAFYEVVPLYSDEVRFADEHGVDELLDRLEDAVGDFVNENRPDVCL